MLLLLAVPLKPFFDAVRHQVFACHDSDGAIRLVNDNHVTEAQRPEDNVSAM
jgi:hypothetical protein